MTDFSSVSAENVRKLLAANNKSIRQLALALDASPSTFTDSLKSKRGLCIDTLCKTARYFDVTVNDLCDPQFEVSESDKAAVTPDAFSCKYRELDAHGRCVVDYLLQKEYERCCDEKV